MSGLVEDVKKVKAELDRLREKFNLMTERKIQETSSGTFFVTLPKEWTVKVGLQKGSKVTLVWSKDDSLTIVA